MSWLTANQVADRLGVKVETVYAYVSRGHLRSSPEPGTRRSRFAEADVERLARRGRPRRTTRPGALDFTIETALTTITDDDVTYRGRSALALARTATFEEVAELLWSGASAVVDAPTTLPWQPVEVTVPEVPTARDRLRLAVVLAAAADPLRADPEPTAVVARARRLIATLTESASSATAGRTPRLVLPDRSAPISGSIAGRLWRRLATHRSGPVAVGVVNAALVLLADHELAVSTLAVRVAASARADPYSAVLSGLGPLAGPLHGGASQRAYELIDAARTHGCETALARTLETQRRLPGFGHTVYLGGDPRARVLFDLIREAFPDDPVLRTADRIVATARRRSEVEPNIDFALATLAHAAGMPADAGEVVFTVARTAGWIAHALEESREAPLRFRARAVTTTARSAP